MQEVKQLSLNERKVLKTLYEMGGEGYAEEVQEKGGFNTKDEVISASSWLRYKGLVSLKEEVKKVYALGMEGERLVKVGLPERRALNYLCEKGKISIEELEKCLEKYEVPIAIGWLKRKGWAELEKEGGKVFVKITESGRKALGEETEEERALKMLKDKGYAELDQRIANLLRSRKNVLEEKELVKTKIILSEKGKMLASKGIEIVEEISQLTPEIIRSGLWKEKKLRAYDIHLLAPAIHSGRPHPLTQLMKEVREIFISMGFEEIEGDYVESCFWNMDVLFIPQDHPARDMQDTLYCKKPKKMEIDRDLLRVIKEIHENGGNTSSRGWGYRFSEEEAKKVLLRTHTTVNTIRYLYKNPEPPAKVFSIGKVFRRENLDATHLPEFYQIEGIVHEEGANFRQLIGILKEFYRRIGFEKIRFRPAYFPYTEPSMEMEVFWKGKWMELGGSGIFRPEVTLPAGVKNPVLAWGLSLERLAMLKLDLDDIRILYENDLKWLNEVPLL
ncbi:MAG: phenylalanine--tRNA ligase subunit alpha [Thermoplasmata archaeon]|nr:MAG: phenylalanine--tRNA ligase subunit alpha [Thermoplasmata archaeon]